MNYNEFLEQVRKVVSVEEYALKTSDYRRNNGKVEPFICVKWETGGVSGGSCWDSSNPTRYTNSEPVPEFTDLDTILEEFTPNITFLQYRNLISNVVESGSYTDYEYYGNSTDYSYKTVDIKKLFDYLDSKGWLK